MRLVIGPFAKLTRAATRSTSGAFFRVSPRCGQWMAVRCPNVGIQITEHIYLDAGDEDVLHVDFTFEDADALEESWVRTHTYNRDEQWAMLEYICSENDRHPVDERGRSEVILSN
jgi:hypothetical protein